MLKAVPDPDLEWRLLVQRPEEDGAHEGLENLNRHFFFLQARINLAACLSGGYDFRDHPAALFHVLGHDFSDPRAGKERGDEGACQVGAAARFLGGAEKEMVED